MGKIDWFSADPEGLAKLLERRGKWFAVFELVQNAWDCEEVKEVKITLEPVPNRPLCRLTVEDDDPEGFKNLAHAYTLFAESEKKGNPGQRGFMNLGEKLVIAACEESEIASTKGTIVFDKEGRHHKRTVRERGSQFTGLIRMTREEFAQTCAKVRTLIPPKNVKTTFNGDEIPYREPLKTFKAQLPTVVADAEGNMRPTRRQVEVAIFAPLADETPTLYEMGIPVVETGDKWHVDIGQKVPLNMDRDNVTPAFLREVRTLVVNEMFTEIEGQEAAATWTKDALSDKDVKPEAVKHLIEEQFGKKVAIFDPSDKEANNRWVGQGGTLLHGRQFTKDQWDNIHKLPEIKPAGQLVPTSRVEFTAGGKELRMVTPENYGPGMKKIVNFTAKLAARLFAVKINVEVCNDIAIPASAFYGNRTFTFNVGRLGYKWFDQDKLSVPVLRLITHELGHEIASNHLSEDYHDALCEISAKMTRLALEEPEFFKE